MKLRDPESQETFDGWFTCDGMSQEELMTAIENELVECRAQAAKVAAEWLIKRGYFNGEITQEITSETGKQIHVEVTLTCFGLPNAIDDNPADWSVNNEA